MKKATIKTRILAGALSAITIFSVGSASITTASAAESSQAAVAAESGGGSVAAPIARQIFSWLLDHPL